MKNFVLVFTLFLIIVSFVGQLPSNKCTALSELYVSVTVNSVNI
ncbi:MAG: hypothetical protein ABFD79_01460 [Phycisphaerales bacterium]